MYLTAATLDDLLRAVIQRLLRSRTRISPTRGGARELTGALLNLRNPRARLSRTETRGRLFSCLGELLWYLSGTNSLKFITHYIGRYSDESDDGKTVYGGYGPRLFGMHGDVDQVKNVRALLKQNLDSRRAVIQLFDAQDIASRHKEIPCTCTMQFLVRHGRLHMVTHMRSNDAFVGLPHDVFAFTMLQEVIARSLGVDVGPYKHAVGSLHLYDRDIPAAEAYLSEGIQSTVDMPAMPWGDPWPAIKTVLRAERQIRLGRELEISILDPYWQDLVRLLQIHSHFKLNEWKAISSLKKKMTSRVFDPYIESKKATALTRAAADKPQKDLFPTLNSSGL